MKSPTNTLAESIVNFERGKNACLDYIDQLIQLKTRFDEIFPAAGTSCGERLDVEKLRAARGRLALARLKILFAGRFKTGKSTLLNALLGRQLLPDDVAPCTAVITEIEYGERPHAVLHFKMGLNPDSLSENLRPEVADHIKRHARAQPPPLEIDLSGEDALVDYLTIPTGEEQLRGVRESPYARCVLQWPLPLCRGGAVLIDSPGLNEHEARDATTMGYLDEADMIVHVLPAGQLCDMADKKFIEEVQGRGKGKFPLIFAVNRFDQLRNDSQRARIRDYARQLKELDGPYGAEGIFFTSALAALEARILGDEETLASSGIPELEKKIGFVFTRDRNAIKLGNFLDVTADLEEFTGTVLPDLRKLLGRDTSRIESEYSSTLEEFARLEQEISSIRLKTERVAARFEKAWQHGLSDFFGEYIDKDLANVIASVNLPEINVLNRKRAVEISIGLLNAAVNESLGEEFRRWLYSRGAELENAAMEEIQDEIQENLREFGDTLARLRAGLDLAPVTCGDMGMVDFMDFMPDALAGAGVGGAVGGAAVFIAARFLPMVAGPVGWAIVAVSTLVMGVSLFLGADGRDKLRKEYLANASRGLMAKCSGEVGEIARVAALKFRERLAELCLCLGERIEDARRPLEITRTALERDRAELDRKKSELEQLGKDFGALLASGRKIAASIAPDSKVCAGMSPAMPGSVDSGEKSC